MQDGISTELDSFSSYNLPFQPFSGSYNAILGWLHGIREDLVSFSFSDHLPIVRTSYARLTNHHQNVNPSEGSFSQCAVSVRVPPS